jgi:hypothetical protein
MMATQLQPLFARDDNNGTEIRILQLPDGKSVKVRVALLPSDIYVGNGEVLGSGYVPDLFWFHNFSTQINKWKFRFRSYSLVFDAQVVKPVTIWGLQSADGAPIELQTDHSVALKVIDMGGAGLFGRYGLVVAKRILREVFLNL